LIQLDASNNPNITDVSWMTNLQILDASDNCGITNQDIKNLNLVKLNGYNNLNITDVYWMTNLLKLDAHGNSGISN